jgi:hypothetical protein
MKTFYLPIVLSSWMLGDDELGEITSTYLGKWDNRQKYV